MSMKDRNELAVTGATPAALANPLLFAGLLMMVLPGPGLLVVAKTDAAHRAARITGIDVMDTRTVDHFMRMASAVRLLGAECVLTGGAATVAADVEELTVDRDGYHVAFRLPSSADSPPAPGTPGASPRPACASSPGPGSPSHRSDRTSPPPR